MGYPIQLQDILNASEDLSFIFASPPEVAYTWCTIIFKSIAIFGKPRPLYVHHQCTGYTRKRTKDDRTKGSKVQMPQV